MWAWKPIIHHALRETMNSTHHLLHKRSNCYWTAWSFIKFLLTVLLEAILLWKWQTGVPKCIVMSLFGMFVDCFSNVAPLDFRLNCSTYLKESSTQTQRNTQLLAICLLFHLVSSSLIKPETMQCPWFYPTISTLLFLLPSTCFTSYLLTADTQSRLVLFTDDISDTSSSPEHHVLSWRQYYTTSPSLVI